MMSIDSPRRLMIGLAFVSVFIDMSGNGIVISVLPYLALRFNANAQDIGYLFASYAAAQMVSVPLSGWLSDKVGRRPLLLASLFGSAIGFFMSGMASTFAELLAARLVGGAFAGSIAIAQSTVADLVPLDERSKYFAVQGIVLSTGLMFGPGLSAGLAQFSLRTPFFVCAGLAAFALIVALKYFDEPSKYRVPCRRGSKPVDDAVALKVDWRMRIQWAVSFLMMLSYAPYLYFGSLLLYTRFGWGTLEVGFGGTAAATFTVMIQAGLYTTVVKKFGKHGTLFIATLHMSVGNLLLAATGGTIESYRGIFLISLGQGCICVGLAVGLPTITVILSNLATPKTQGTVLGTSQGLQALARVVGPLLGGALFDVTAALPFIVASGIGILACLASYISLCIARHHVDVKAPPRDNEPRLTEMQTHDSDLVNHLRRENAHLRALLADANLPTGLEDTLEEAAPGDEEDGDDEPKPARRRRRSSAQIDPPILSETTCEVFATIAGPS